MELEKFREIMMEEIGEFATEERCKSDINIAHSFYKGYFKEDDVRNFARLYKTGIDTGMILEARGLLNSAVEQFKVNLER